jgi:glycosyltransferase involved in cell wall biosynthesis
MENNSIKLSIIVPVYKTEQYLHKCLSSIFEQEVDRSLYEVIIVNDGSPDNSQAIIDDFCAKYENASCLKQANQGLSMARNNGVAQARGEYIWYIDSDDWVKENSIHDILKECSHMSDVVSITYMKDEPHTTYPTSYSTTGLQMLQSKRFANGMVFYIVRREFIKAHNLSIYPGIYHEDSEFTPRMLYYAKSIRVIPEPLYYMYANPTSITRSVNPKKSHDLLIVADHIYKFKETVVEPSIHKVLDYLISIHINSALANIIKSNRAEHKRFNLALYENRHLFSALWNSSLKYRVEYIFFRLFPRYYVETYRMMKRK